MATSDPASQTSSVRRIAFTVVGALIFFFAISVLMERRTPSSSQARVQAFIVPMAAEVAGRISDVPVIDNSKVQEGDVLFRIDPVPFRIAIKEAEAKLQRIGQSVGAGVSGIDAAQARAVEARANREKIRDQANRVFQLVERGVYPEAKYHELKGSLDASEAAVQAAEAELEKARRDLGATGSDNPQIREALAALEKARLDLTRTTVNAPADGVITNLQLAAGQFVSTGQAALTFIDAGTIWVSAAFKENSLENIQAGNEAEVVLDTLPGKLFKAKVESVGWGVSSESSSNGLPTVRNNTGWVREPQRFPVRLVFADERPIGVRHGSQANVMIYTGRNPIANLLGVIWIRLISVVTYVH
ncbi:MAG TPA: HlyD family secretion protein [Xanthobacteraceae bacterium]|nr:HlyD family secretion protein [Xanthobacteraceae bacterium]